MLLRFLLPILASLFPFTSADVQIISPAAGDSVPIGIITTTWQESGTPPLIANLAGYQAFLMCGGNNDAVSEQLSNFAGNLQTGGTKATLPIAAAAGPPAANAYYIKIISAPTSGTGQVINYSQRFSISGMTGIWSSTAAEADFKTVTGTAGPAAVNTVQAGGAVPGAGGAGGGADGSFGISYQFQTEGLTRYAPMQPKPGSTITATNTAPMFPPSAFSVATTLLPTPSIVTTITQPVDYSASTSIENTGLPAAQPSDDMQKFLNRWKD